jgi:hypothetical protein
LAFDQITSSVLRARLAKQRYVLALGLIPNPQRRLVYDYIVETALEGGMMAGDAQVPNTPAAYADPVAEAVLEELLPTVSAIFGRDLVPTNSYLRLYKRGDKLAKHVDRPGCECSVSVCFGYEPDAALGLPRPEPRERRGRGRPHAPRRRRALLRQRVPALARGLRGRAAGQVFFHYVDKVGGNAEWAYDKRGRGV